MESFFDQVVSTKRPVESLLPEDLYEKKDRYAGIPQVEKPTMWDYSIEEDGDGNRILSFLVDENAINFKLQQNENNILAERFPDANKEDFGRRGNAIKGRFQVHKASPTNIYGTIQGGSAPMTFSMDQTEDSKWTMTGKRSPLAEISDLLQVVRKKTASIDPYNTTLIDKITSPVTGPMEFALPASALIGAGAMTAKNLGQRLLAKIRGEEEPKSNILMDALLGAAGGAALTYGFKRMGESQDPFSPQFNYMLRPEDDLIFGNEKVPVGERFVNKFKKTASMQVDVERIKRILNSDYGLTSADKRVLMDQLNRAVYQQGSSSLNLDRLRGGAFGALLGYILAKVLGMGGAGTAAASVIGGLLGSQGGHKSRKNDPRGFYYY
jgi:hypothetical protein